MTSTSQSFATLTAQQIQDLTASFGLTCIRLSDGHEVTVRDTVAGDLHQPVLVCLHGIGSGSASWVDMACALAPKVRVMAWDAPGYGESDNLPADAPNALDYALRLKEVLHSLAIDDFILVGHSLGALVAAAYLTLEDTRSQIRAAVLISPARGYGAAALREQGQQVRERRLQALAHQSIAEMAAERAPHLLSPAASANARAAVHWNMANLHDKGYRQAVELLCGDDLFGYAAQAMAANMAGKTRIPMHVWCGMADTITPPESAQQVAGAYGVALELIESAGHACYVEQPDTVAHLLRQIYLSCANQGEPHA